MLMFYINNFLKKKLVTEKTRESAVIYDEVQPASAKSHTHTGGCSAECFFFFWHSYIVKVTMLCVVQDAGAALWCALCGSVWWQHVWASPASPCCQWSSPSLCAVSLSVSVTHGWLSARVTLCFLFTAVNKVISEQNRAQSNLTEQVDHLQDLHVHLERQVLELSEERDRLNWTLGVILENQNFPVAYRCPHRGESDRPTDTFQLDWTVELTVRWLNYILLVVVDLHTETK